MSALHLRLMRTARSKSYTLIMRCSHLDGVALSQIAHCCFALSSLDSRLPERSDSDGTIKAKH